MWTSSIILEMHVWYGKETSEKTPLVSQIVYFLNSLESLCSDSAARGSKANTY